MVKKIKLEARICECCNSNNLEELWKYNHIAQTRNNCWDFYIRNVICKDCGFVFLSPVPSADDLINYYADSWTFYDKQVINYNIENRISFIKRNVNNSSLFIEIGSLEKTEFQERLSKLFTNVFTVEVNNSVERSHKSLYDLQKNSADVLGLFFVLEHIPRIKEFLSNCYDILKIGGIMICEVPDIRLYSKDVSGLILYEHVNHFSLGKLEHMARNQGFRLMESSHKLCSRGFGFVTAFIKEENKSLNSFRISTEYSENKKVFLKGIQKIRKFNEGLTDAYLKLESYSKGGKKSVLWGANDNLRRFLVINKKIPDNTIIIDSNPDKKSFFGDFLVFQPDEVAQHITDSDLILIFTRLNSKAILEFIKTKYKKTFDKDNILILDITVVYPEHL